MVNVVVEWWLMVVNVVVECGLYPIIGGHHPNVRHLVHVGCALAIYIIGAVISFQTVW